MKIIRILVEIRILKSEMEKIRIIKNQNRKIKSFIKNQNLFKIRKTFKNQNFNYQNSEKINSEDA